VRQCASWCCQRRDACDRAATKGARRDAAENHDLAGFAAAAGESAAARVIAQFGALLVGIILAALVISPVAFDRAADDLKGVGRAVLCGALSAISNAVAKVLRANTARKNRFRRESDGELSPPSVAIGGAHLASLLLHYAVYDVQTQPPGLGGNVRVEDHRQKFRRDAAAFIATTI